MKTILILASIFITGCNSQQINLETYKNDTALSSKNIKVSSIAAGCYGWAIQKDSAFMNINSSGNKVTGTLKYRLYEKDNNTGTINGILQDSLIIASYTFQSEGMTSVREVVFKMSGDSLMEGFGDVIMSDDTVKYKNRNLLQFQNERAFVKINCR